MGLLSVNDLHISYGQIRALKGISLDLTQGEIVTLIGNNGAGKTTTLKTIAGVLKPLRGEVVFKGEPIHGLPSFKIVEKGISLVPEGRRIFSALTVQENLEMGAYLRSDRAGIAESMDKVFGLFPILKERRRQHGGTLSGGEQQMLAIGRALMGRPQLLLLDEPSLGLAPKVVEQIAETIVEIQRQGTSILLVEQNAMMSLSLADRAYVLETGEITLQGAGAELLENPAVQKAYLGM
ncbi:MAG: ABC transporter ATP-binding protein [Ignavibacteriales bacterium]